MQRKKRFHRHLGGYAADGDSHSFVPELWKWLAKGKKSVLDVGCGEAHSTKFFHDFGCKVLGIEGSKEAISGSVIPQKVVLHDFCEGPYLPKKKNLIWSGAASSWNTLKKSILAIFCGLLNAQKWLQ